MATVRRRRNHNYMRISLLLLVFVFVHPFVHGQACSTLGQTPSSAFPVCGSNVFQQSSVPLCQNNFVPTKGCSSQADKNPYWYKITCYQAGTLGFVIEPLAANEDYDWQLFDVTGHQPKDVYTDDSLIVIGNWAGTYGNTGASGAGVGYTQCSSDPAENKPAFATMPQLQKGHIYLLLVSHFSDTQSGYKLSFGGGTAVITDTTTPHLSSVNAACDAQHLTVVLTKRLQCASLAADGSDFILSPANAAISAAVAPACATGFDMDTVLLTLSSPLSPGDYSLVVKKGTDYNTLLDNCGLALPVNESKVFHVNSSPAAFPDSIAKPGCAPRSVTMIFNSPFKCNSVAADGSDFVVSGPGKVDIVAAQVKNCSSGGLGTQIDLQFALPVYDKGTYEVKIKTGTDGNTIISECNQSTPVDTGCSFIAYDTVSAKFSYTIYSGCEADTVVYAHDGKHGVNQWDWLFDNDFRASSQNVTKVYTTPGEKLAKLKVSNGVCTDSSSQVIELNSRIKAYFGGPSYLCPNDKAQFVDSSQGSVVSWEWDFGNGNTASVQDPPAQTYPVQHKNETYAVWLRVSGNDGCKDSISKPLVVTTSCFVAVPSAFTPNGDGNNDYLYPLNGFEVDDLSFKVFNRYGQLVFSTNRAMDKWDGKVKGVPSPTGTYVWIFSYTDRKTKQHVTQHGTSVLIR
jgi:gliding motility-associated-like protein